MSSDLLESVRNNPEILLEFAQRLLDENNRNRELQSQINDLQPKANYFDHFMVKENAQIYEQQQKKLEYLNGNS